MDLSSFQRQYFEIFRELPEDKREFVLELMRRCVSGQILPEKLTELVEQVKSGKKLEEIKAAL
jgi:hypothetical protein